MEYQHKISLPTAILMNINMMVGVGAFFGPQLMAKKAGFASFLGWPLVALIFLPIVLSIANMARIFPGAGSFYSYSKKIISPTTGFISGWMFFLGYAGVASLQILCLRDIISQYIFITPVLFNLIVILVIISIALLKLQTIGRIQNAGTFFKLLPLLFVLSIFAAYWNPAFHITTQNIMNLPTILPIALFGFWGFECCCTISHLIEGEKSNASRAVLIAFFITTVIYTLFHLGLLHIMGTDNLVQLGSEDVVQFLGIKIDLLKNTLIFFITSAIILAYVNAILSVYIANSLTLHAMATEKLFPLSEKIALQNKFHRPWAAIVIQGVFTFFLATLINNKFILTSMSNLGVLSSFFLTLVALFIIQKQNKKYLRIIITILAFISWFILSYFSWFSIGQNTVERLITILPLLLIFVTGLIMYIIKNKISKRA